MTQAQALGILAGLRAAFPRQRFDQEAAQVYATQILDLDAEVCMRAVQSLIRTSPWFPTISDIREEFKRFWDSRERPPAIEAHQPSAEERAKQLEMMRGWVRGTFGLDNKITADPTAGLKKSAAGRCDDCAEKVRLRWEYGRFTLCGDCVTNRVRVAAQVLS